MIRKAMAKGAMLISRNLAKNLEELPEPATASCLAQRCARKSTIATTPTAVVNATRVVMVVMVVVVTVVIIAHPFVQKISQSEDFVKSSRKITKLLRKEIWFDF